MFGSNTVITGGTFTQNYTPPYLNTRESFKLLQDACAPGAFHNSGDRRDPPRCHSNTRVAILDKIIEWVNGLDPEALEYFGLWLYGPARSGKSAIAQSIAERCEASGLLLSTFFFVRSDQKCNNSKSLVETLAYQFAISFPEVKEAITSIIDHDPLILTRTLETRFVSLIIDPLGPRVDSGYFSDSTSRRLVIIDGLDECLESTEQTSILRMISDAFRHRHLPVKFLICSRPELNISTAFNMGYLNKVSTCLSLDADYRAYEDIRLFLCDGFDDINQNHPFKDQIPKAWPTEDNLQHLVSKSSGQFIYVATVMKFISSIRHCPVNQPEIVLGIRASNNSRPFSELDALYVHILLTLSQPELTLRILAFQIHNQALCFGLRFIEMFFGLETGDATVILSDLSSVLYIKKKESRNANDED